MPTKDRRLCKIRTLKSSLSYHYLGISHPLVPTYEYGTSSKCTNEHPLSITSLPLNRAKCHEGPAVASLTKLDRLRRRRMTQETLPATSLRVEDELSTRRKGSTPQVERSLSSSGTLTFHPMARFWKSEGAHSPSPFSRLQSWRLQAITTLLSRGIAVPLSRQTEGESSPSPLYRPYAARPHSSPAGAHPPKWADPAPHRSPRLGGCR